MRVVVIGAGGVGGYVGGRLAQAGADVTLIARGEHLRAMQRGGLRITSIAGDAHIAQIVATDDAASVGLVDMVLLAVKSWQVAAAAEAARPLLGPGTGIVPLLNGVEAAAALAATLGVEHVLDGVCYIHAFVAEAGHIRHDGIEPRLVFGERDNRRSPRVEGLRALLAEAGMEAVVPPDIAVAVWRKFLFGATTSGIGALTRTAAGVLRSLPLTRSLYEQGMREVLALAQALGVALTAQDLYDALALLDRLPPGTTASMQRDIMAGKPSELEAQSGAVVRLGAAAGVPTPLHGVIYAALLPQELAARRAL